ncbi:MutS protein homolog [Schizosaccharomyces pombe]|uniref:DNA mismatch repair protein msh6 n=1 Tax=Schizosaccharomyces pombe (strain 972 / ATCC 24843) TaxID=284812 RepID=MSH6_SCHPO|nr:DNA mismatch repair protein [Schizosaccharomyces pombe]O74502.1 RecName: Full=DNA mismatch repair protein msh6 [Schizosaccharomyces pombe 972h-]AAF20943.1 mismatch repair protein Msh6 [Schizosaccharomyces pombe]CAA20855.1 MutS protein homolog [Schizosaccharomyces pombe]|eukprot:NP_588344.1 DNA mismatch repair protein [Schizosaccharomyces pombe]
MSVGNVGKQREKTKDSSAKTKQKTLFGFFSKIPNVKQEKSDSTLSSSSNHDSNHDTPADVDNSSNVNKNSSSPERELPTSPSHHANTEIDSSSSMLPPPSSDPFSSPLSSSLHRSSPKRPHDSLGEESPGKLLRTSVKQEPDSEEEIDSPTKKKSFKSLDTSIFQAEDQFRHPVSSKLENSELSEVDKPFIASRRSRKPVSYAESDEDEDFDDAPTKGSRHKRIVSDDESDDYVEPDHISEASSEASLPIDEVESMDEDVDGYSDHSVSVAAPIPKKESRKESSNSLYESYRLGSQIASPSPSVSGSASPTKSNKNGVLNREEKRRQRMEAFKKENNERYEWLLDVRDADQNRVGDPNYDPRTLYIPPSAWATFKPFEKQFWKIKKDLMDTVVFFQKGKFYELYENDAAIGHQVFSLKLTDRVNMKMVGIPEASFDYWASQFIAKGYRIARVDQLETALGKEIKDRQRTQKEEKVVQRGLTQVLTSGTLVDEAMLTSDLSTYCMAIKESLQSDNEEPSFGICFIDTSTGGFHMCEFTDDIHRTKLDTLLTQVRPKELILEKSKISQKSIRAIKYCVSSSSIWNFIKPYTEFWDNERVEREIIAGDYFKNGLEGAPKILKSYLSEKPLAISAFGALFWYLRQLKLDKDMCSMGNFDEYDASQQSTSLLMNGQTLKNLEIFSNSFDGGSEGTLFHLLCRCVTPFGKRLFHTWLCHPLRSGTAINARLDVVELIADNPVIRDTIWGFLHKLPDLERLISRVHAGRSKPADFVRVLEGFQRINSAFDQLREEFMEVAEGTLLGEIIQSAPNMKEELEAWTRAFNWQKASEEGVFEPEIGFEAEYDTSQKYQSELKNELYALLEQYKKQLRCSSLNFKNIGKEVYQVEVPSDVKVPVNWCKMSGTKKTNRYYNDELRKKIKKLLEAEELHLAIMSRMQEKFYIRFDSNYEQWLALIKYTASIDCFFSLSQAAAALGEPYCRPEIIEQKDGHLYFEELRHPCINASAASTFVPNDVVLGGESPNMIVLTGPNMAGKSTLLRQVCIAVIMAQLGCWVPAKRASITPMTSIYTRLGANDDIMSARSTFMVELSETKKILDECGPKSLVILDELGRGTSTYDGHAIAYAVLHHLVSNIGCLGFFSTHYQSLCVDFMHHRQVRLMQMAAAVDEKIRRVTFLYKLEDGICPKSYGMNVASMAGLPEKVIDAAEEKASELEQASASFINASDDIALMSDFLQVLRISKSIEPLTAVNIPLILDSFE